MKLTSLRFSGLNILFRRKYHFSFFLLTNTGKYIIKLWFKSESHYKFLFYKNKSRYLYLAVVEINNCAEGKIYKLYLYVQGLKTATNFMNTLREINNTDVSSKRLGMYGNKLAMTGANFIKIQSFEGSQRKFL